MRPIKFRAWDKKGNRWVTNNVAIECGGMWLWVFGYGINPLDKEDYEVMQFTGLLDKNGKEIYEGDLVRAYTYFDEEENELCDSTVHEIVWGNDYPAFEMKPAPCEECNSLQNFAVIQPEGEKIEVIGNIHENPELLK